MMKRIIALIAILCLFLTACQEKLDVKGKIEHFTLTDTNGNTYNSDNGKVKLLTFFYVNCPDICPLTLFELKEVQKELIDNGLLPGEVEIIAVTMDPTNDTVNVLRDYKKNYNASEEGWKFLTGSDEQIQSISDDLKFFYAVSESGLVSHATTMYLLDEDNQIRALHKMSSVDNESIDHNKIMEDIKSLAD